MPLVSIVGMGQFGQETAYVFACDQSVPVSVKTGSFSVPGAFNAIWIRSGLKASVTKIDVDGGFTLTLKVSQNIPPGQPLPPVIIKGNGGSGGPDEGNDVSVDIGFKEGMSVHEVDEPPFRTEVIITSDLGTYESYSLSAGGLEISGELLPGFEISFGVTAL